MKKRFVSLLLAISMILSLMPVSAVTAFAQGESSGEVSGYCGAENGGKNLSWTLDNNGVLTITGNGAMKDYSGDSDAWRPDWYGNRDGIRSVVLDDNITHIGNYAFDDCTHIESVRYTRYNNGNAGIALPEKVTTIGDHAFSRTGVKGTLELPKNLTAIGADAFYQCKNLIGSLVIPQGIKRIEKETFDGCGFTGDITIPDGMTTIGNSAFYDCTKIKSVRYTSYHGDAGIALPKNVTTIGQYAFSGTGVTGPLELPDDLTEIGAYAFCQCSNLKGTLTIPKNIKAIEDGVFALCGFTGNLVIPDDVTKIGKSAFQSTYKSKSSGTLTLPDRLTEIGAYAFIGSQFQGGLTIPDSVKTLGEWAFENGSFSGELKLSNSLTTLNIGTFYNCRGFCGNLVIPARVTTIGEEAFYYSYYGEPTGEKGRLIFADDSQLKEIGKGAFQNCPNLTGELKLPNTVERIGALAFSGCNGFTGELELPVSLKELRGSAFENCSGLTGKLTFPSNVSKINGTVFYGTGITEVVIPSSIKEVCIHAFCSCDNLKKVYLPAKIPTIDDMAFRSCSNVKFYYPGYKADWETQTDKLNDSILNSDKNAVKPVEVGTWRPICYYVDVTFDAGSGEFQDGAQRHIVKGNEKELYRTENLTEDMVTAIGTPKQSGYHFAGWSLKPNGSVDDVLQVADGYMTIADNGKNEFGGVEDGMTLYAVYTSAASVKINGFAADGEATAIKAGKEHEFTLIGDENTDTGATVTLALNGSTNAKLEYYNSTTGEWQEVTDALNVSAVNGMKFRVAVPKNADDATVALTAVVKDASGNEIEDGGDSKTFTVNKYVNAAVSFAALDGETIKQNKPHTFTVTVTTNDDSDKGPGKLDFGDKNEEIEWKNPNPADQSNPWEKIPADGLTVDFSSSQSSYKLRITPKTNGEQSLTATVTDKDGNKLADCKNDYTVAAYVNAAIAITPATANVETDTAQEFTVTVTANDDAGKNVTAKAGFTGPAGGVKKLEYEFNGNWKDVTNQNFELNLNSLQSGTYKIRVTFAAAGEYKLNASLTKAGDTVASSEAGITVTAKLTPAPNPDPGEDGGSTNPGGNPGSGSTKPEQETPKRKLEIADGTLTSVTVKDENGNLKDITDTITKDLDGKYEIPVGAKVTITAKDAPEGMKFGEWSISDKTLLGDPDVPYTEKDLIFTMPDNPDGVKLSVVYLEESIGEEPNLLEKGALAGTVVVGSAALLYQGHMLGTELYLRYLLPHGAVIPQNRAELAVLLWQDAENPEPVSTTLYSDISDEDSAIQQAARWAVENDLMEQLDADEHPDHFDPFVPVTFSDSIRAWKKAQELKKSVH